MTGPTQIGGPPEYRERPRKKRKPPQDFVKARDTNVPVRDSQDQIRELVRKHGAAGFSVVEDYRHGGAITVEFAIRTTPDGAPEPLYMPVKLPVQVGRVYKALYPNQFDKNKNDPGKNKPDIHLQRRAQAERVAWRQLYLIIDATLTAAALGILTLQEAFMAHVVVVDEQGQQSRMGDWLENRQGALGSGFRALIPAKTGGGDE